MEANCDELQFADKVSRSTCDVVATLAHTIITALSACCGTYKRSFRNKLQDKMQCLTTKKIERFLKLYLQTIVYPGYLVMLRIINALKSSFVSNSSGTLNGVFISLFSVYLKMVILLSPILMCRLLLELVGTDMLSTMIVT